MTTGKNSFLAARQAASSDDSLQARNRLWWERMPMTYADWQAENRLPAEAGELTGLSERVLAEGPWLRRWFESKRFDGMRVLDLGCGSGVFATVLAKNGGDVTGVDLTETGVRLARMTAAANKQPITVARMDAEKLAFRDGLFDFVFSWGVLHHTANMDQAVDEAGRVLAPGGRGIIMVYHRSSVVYWLHGLFWLIGRGKLLRGYTLRTVQDFYTDGFYHRYLTRGELRSQLTRAGLKAEQVTITQYYKKILPFIPRALDEFLKARFGMCLVIEFHKPQPGSANESAPARTPGIGTPTEAPRPGERLLVAAFTTWTIAAFAAYLYQFRDLLRPVLHLFGLAA